MEFTARQISDLLQGEVLGNADSTVNRLSKIEEATAGSLSFLANPKYEEFIYSTGASVVIVNRSFTPEKPVPSACTLVKVENAYASFARLLELYDQYRHARKGVHAKAWLHESVKVGNDVLVAANASVAEGCVIGDNVKIYENAVIMENVSIGNNSVIGPGVVVMHDCVIGANCKIQPNAVIGGDGFGFAPNEGNEFRKVPQIGNVILEDNVEIGANSTIDRATMGSTVIRRGVKLDNLIQIAHNVEIGENTVIAAQSGVAGSTRIGRNCMIGGQVGIIGHLKIADGVKIAAQSGIGQDITQEGQMVQGSPAFEIGPYKRSYVGFRNLPKIQGQIADLEKEIEQLKKRLHG
jgi:UDP-3-O-[3-hydroxymyristoyl] glucosamine N-acyltransferase